MLEIAFQKLRILLVDRFDLSLKRNKTVGLIRTDRSSNQQYVLNKKDQNTKEATYNLQTRGSYWRKIDNILEDPLFIDSKKSNGIQIADAISYCVVDDKMFRSFKRVN